MTRCSENRDLSIDPRIGLRTLEAAERVDIDADVAVEQTISESKT